MVRIATTPSPNDGDGDGDGDGGSSIRCNFLYVRDFSTSAASLNGLAPMGVEDACARETRVATKAYDLWITTGNPDATCNSYRAVCSALSASPSPILSGELLPLCVACANPVIQ